MYNATVGKIAGLVSELNTQADIKEVMAILRARWNRLSVVEAAKGMQQFRMGQVVRFATKRGTMLGKVSSINTKTVGVEVPSGMGDGVLRWRVAPSLLSGADECEYDAFKKRAQATPFGALADQAALGVEIRGEKRSEADIMQEIRSIYSDLSPENLSCDGELAPSAVRRRSADLNARLRACFRELGREVSESEFRGTSAPARELAAMVRAQD